MNIKLLTSGYPDALDPPEHGREKPDVRIRFGNAMMGDTIVRVAKDPRVLLWAAGKIGSLTKKRKASCNLALLKKHKIVFEKR